MYPGEVAPIRSTGTRLSPCAAGVTARLLAPCLQTGTLADLLQGSEPRELIREYYRLRHRARDLTGAADAAAGHTVCLGARDERRGQEAAAPIGAHPVRLDVTSDESVQAAVAAIGAAAGHLDVLVNNAGISGNRKLPGDVTAADLETVYATNVFGVVRVTQAFLPLLEASDIPVIVNVSSGLGSMAVTKQWP